MFRLPVSTLLQQRLRAALAVCALLISASSGPASADPVRMLANASPPYADKKLPEQGLALELVAHVMERAGYDAELTIESWPRALEGVRIGLYEALATAWYSDERDQDFLFSEPYLDSQLILIKLRAAPGVYDSLDDLEGKRLGVRADYAYGVDFSGIAGLRLVEENHLIQSLMNLINGRVDVVIGDQRTVALQLEEYLQSQRHRIEVAPIMLPGRSRHVAASRALNGSEKMIEDFNKALAEARDDGSVAAIIAKWDGRYNIPSASGS